MEEYLFTEFKPELDLDRTEQAQLASIVGQPGFQVLQKIGKACVDQFVVASLNTPDEDEKAVLSKHRSARIAAQLWTSLIANIRFEVEEYIGGMPKDMPIESAENLDLGEYVHPGIAEEEPLF